MSKTIFNREITHLELNPSLKPELMNPPSSMLISQFKVLAAQPLNKIKPSKKKKVFQNLKIFL